ncbi:MAG TPA: hypothetical protein HA258_03855 [Thermoplasmata archaeon]|nr:hypothetical protein [Thermoplasmata archaeon]
MDTQKIDSSKVKSHDEILKLFEDVRSAEARVNNPEAFTKAPYEQFTVLRQNEPPVKQPREPPQKTPSLEPTREIHTPEQEEQKKPFFKRAQKPQMISEKKRKWLDILKIEVTEDEELTPVPEVESQPEDLMIQTSTFVLQLDPNGNLVGFPMKKIHERKKPEQTEESEGESEKGIKGTFKHLVSKFRRKKSEESESSGGIADKIKGIFRRKNKE